MTTPSSYADARAASPQARPSDLLVRLAQPAWDQACAHRFTRELGDDTLPETVFARYLVQDYLFVTDLVSLLGHLIARAPSMSAKHRYATFAAMVSSEENDFFQRAFAAVGVDPATLETAEPAPAIRGFAGLMISAAQRSYVQGLACLLCAEWCYLTWGQREADGGAAPRLHYREWIDLHSGPDFTALVEFLRLETDRVMEAAPPEDAEAAARAFIDMTELEVEFFDWVYGSE